MADPVRKLERARRDARRFAVDARKLAARRGRQGRRRSGAPAAPTQSSTLSTARKADCGISTLPTCFMRFFPSFCFSRSLRLREMSPP